MSGSEEIVLPYRGHANACLGFAAVLLLTAAVAAPCGATVLVLVATALAVTPLVVGLVLRGVARGYERSVRALLAGERGLHWTYDGDEWRRHLAAETARNPWLWALVVGMGALAGVGVAAGMAEDGVRPFGVRELAWVLPPLGGAGLGLVVATVMRWHRRRNLARMANTTGVFCLGKTGMYLTGSYWPWRGVGITFDGVRLDDGALTFRFVLSRGGVQTVRVPIARGHEAEARAFAAAAGE